MKPGALVLGLLLFGAASPVHSNDEQRVCGDKPRIEKLMGQTREKLAELRGMSSAHPDYITRREMTRKADELRRLLERIDAELALQYAPPPPPIQPPPVQPMEAGRFTTLLNTLGAEAFPKGKLRVVKQAGRHDHFSVDQVRRVMRQFSFADGKVQAAATLYPKLVDPQNFFQVYEELDFEADKNRLRELTEK